MTIPAWTQAVRLHSDVLSGETSVSLYAIDLGELVRGGESVSHVYRDARNFFNATHMTEGLSQLLGDILARLSGQPGDRVLQLHSPFFTLYSTICSFCASSSPPFLNRLLALS